VLILLPPSEGKSAAPTGNPVRLAELQFPELTDARNSVLTALGEVSAAEDAHAVLGVGFTLTADVQRNLVLDVEPAAPAHDIYSGVLYDALGYRRMTPMQQARARRDCVVVSGLWGAVGFGDAIPAYRLSMSVDLPSVGRLASYWKQHLAAPLSERAGTGLVVDCRSSTYAAAWAAPPQQSAAVNVFQLRNGRRTVVSHFAKHTRGELARHLVTRSGPAPETPMDLLEVAGEKWTADLDAPRGRKPAQLNILLD
jgi:cytoplasmic iron level regulating protein YaaA (DUF328/UPF0246 family)